MKKSLSIVLATILFLSLFTGCDKNKKVDKVESNVQLTSQYENSTELVGDPKATGELKVAFLGSQDTNSGKPNQCDLAIEKFKKLYPGVMISAKEYPFESDYAKSSKQLADQMRNSDGPDIVVMHHFMGIENLIKNDVLFDMSEYMKNDSSINLNDYNSSVLFDSQPNDKQLFIPLNYNIPMLLTTQSLAESYKIDSSQLQDCDSLMNEMSRLIQESKGKSNITTSLLNFSTPFSYPWLANMKYTTKEEITEILNSPNVKKNFELYKSYCFNYKPTFEGEPSKIINSLKTKQSILAEFNFDINNLLNTVSIINSNEKSVIVPWRNNNGNIIGNWNQCAVINKKSSNTQNAYNLIKVLLDSEIQYSTVQNSWEHSIPISNSAVKKYLTNQLLSEEAIDLYSDKSKAKADSTALINELVDYINQVEGSSLQLSIHDILYEAMEPYFNNKRPYEECITDAQKKIQTFVFG